MKNFLIPAIVVCFVISSCYQEEIFSPLEADFGYTAEIESFAGDTKTSLNESNSIEWSENDRIAIFQGSSVADIFEVTSSSVGRTTATFREVVEYTDDGFVSGNELETNVAVYPYVEGLECSNSTLTEEGDVFSYKIDNVELPSVQKWQSSSFPDDAFVMVAVTNGISDRKLKFRNVCGALRLRVNGDAVIKNITLKGHSGELLSGSASVYACTDGTTAPVVSMHSSASETVTLDCGDGVRLSPTSPTDFIIALPPTSFTKGFTVTLTDVNGKKDTRSSDRLNVIGRSAILAMPEITFGEGELTLDKCTDIAVEESANCYVISKSGSYSFPAVKGNGTKSVGTVASVDVLWETFGTDEEVHKGDLITSVAYENSKILFRTASRFREGNAVIAARNSSGTILWSWHIWLTDKPSEHVYKNGAGTMMDRNLGATSATPGDVGALGLQYQWGRKDPFLSYADIHERSAVVSTIKWPSSVRTSPETGTVGYSIANPTTIIHDWDNYDDWLTSPNHSLWDDDKTIYDPCPAGWRVPDGGPQGVWKRAGFSGTEKFDNTNKGVNFSIEQPSSTWYPIKPPSSGSSYHSASYWSVDVMDDESYQFCMIYDENGFRIYNWDMPRNYNEYVRCYKEDSAIQVPPSMENATDLNPSGETANCYIVSKKGNYKFKAVQGNSSTSVGSVASVEVLWETYGTSSKPTVGSLIKSVGYYNGLVSFSTADSFKEGNALIAAKDASGTILWSWHIWLTDTPAEHTYYGSNIAMDRNLGATSSATSSVGALGLLYQWGRKDPFLGSSSISSDVVAKSVGESWPSAVNSSSSTGTISYVTAHPMQFVLGTTYTDDDWLYSYRDDTLWGETKTQYDPCPPGWRVPSYMIWLKAGFLTEEFNSSTRGATFSISNPSTTWYPASGASFGDYLIETGTSGCYWSCNLQDSSPIFMYLTDDPNSQDTYYILNRHFACSIRCMKD